jgi:hypothetical protein
MIFWLVLKLEISYYRVISFVATAVPGFPVIQLLMRMVTS